MKGLTSLLLSVVCSYSADDELVGRKRMWMAAKMY